MVLGGQATTWSPALDDHDQRRAGEHAHREGQAHGDHRAHPQGRRRDREPDGHVAYYAGDERGGHGRAYLLDQKRLLARGVPRGEFGYSDLFMGVPAIVGGKGVEKIIELPLTAEEKGMLE